MNIVQRIRNYWKQRPVWLCYVVVFFIGIIIGGVNR